MKKNKKLLTAFLALNGILSSYTTAATESGILKYDKLYNTITKNLEQGKSNESSYKLIEKVLKKKNKELKDLYHQGDYIVKPEYLEWQIFFSGFYNEDARVGGISSNHSREGNDSESNWSGKNKPKILADSYKEVKVGPSIPYKYLNIQDINPDVSLPVIDSVASINLNKIPLVIDIPQLPALPNIQLNTVNATNINDIVINKNVQVTPININVSTKTFGAVTLVNPQLARNGNGYSVKANSENVSTNVDFRMASYTKTLTTGASQTGLIQIIGPHGTIFPTTMQANGTGDMSYVLSDNLETQKVGSRVVLIESHRGTDGAYTVGDINNVLYVKSTGVITSSVSYTDSADTTLLSEIEGGYGSINQSVFENAGTMRSTGTGKTIGMEFKSGSDLVSTIKVINSGIIDLLGEESVGIDSLQSQNVNQFNIGVENTNSGTIILRGNKSFGILLTQGKLDGTNTITPGNMSSAVSNTYQQNGTITMKGKNSYGVVIGGGTELPANTSLNSGIINIENTGAANSTETSSGIYLNKNLILDNRGTINVSGNYSNGIRVDAGTMSNRYTAGKQINISGSASESTGIAVVNSSSTGINEGKILINSTGSKNIGLYGTGGGGIRIENRGSNAEIKLDLGVSSGSENIGASITGAGSIFTNNGLITLIDINPTGKNVGIYSENGTVNHTGTINLTTKGNDIGIYLKGAAGGTLAGAINLSSTGSNYDYGIYYDNGYTGNAAVNSTILLEGKSAGVFSALKTINFGGIINMSPALSQDSIGLLYQISASSPAGNILTNNGTVNAAAGTGIYIYNNASASGKTVINNAGKTIKASDGGVGIVAESAAYASGDKIEIINNGTILNTASSTANSIGIYAKNHDIKVTGAGKISVESPGSENLGIFIKGGKTEFESNIELGNGGIGVYLDGDSLNANDSVLDIGNTANAITALTDGTGIVVKGEKATVNILSNGINLNGHSAANKGSLGLFIENGNINNNGTVKTGNYGTAVYLKSTASARTVNLGKLETGENGVGIYLENQNIVDTLTSITTGKNSIAVYSKNGDIDTNVLNSSKFILGEGSTGYFLENGTIKSSVANTDLILGNNVTGVALTGNSGIDSSINSITIGNNTGSASGIKPIVLGIKEISAPLTLTTKLTGGDGTVGLYYQEGGTGNSVTYNGGSSTTIPDIKTGITGGNLSSVGVYLKADTGLNALDINNTYIQVNGKSGIVLGADTGTINVNGGKVELTEGGVLFLVKNGGKVNVSPGTQILTPDSGIELFRVIYSDYTNTAGTVLEIPKESVAIHGETGIMTNEGELVSKIISGTPAESSIGMYIENTKEIAPNTLEFSNTASQGINKNKIDLGYKGIGIFGENSYIQNETSGTISIGNEGAGLYATIGSIIENKGIINIGENSVGMYALDRAGSPGYTGLTKENYLTNSGKIVSLGNNTLGISSTGVDPGIRSEIINTGAIALTGVNTTGIYGNRTNILNTGDITTGDGLDSGGTIQYASGIIGNESSINITGGQIQTGNYSIGAAATGNSSLNITGGSITVGENSIFNYIKRGAGTGVTLTDTSGGTYNLNKNKQIGIYTEEGDVTSNKTIEVRDGSNAIGVYAQNNGTVNMSVQGLTINVESGQKGIYAKSVSGTGVKIILGNTVNLNGNSALGIIHQDGDLENNGLINVSGTGSVGILSSNSDNINMNSLLNTGNINVNSESGIGIYGTTSNNAKLNILNAGNIVLGASASQNSVILGIYGAEGSEITNTGNITAGENSIALYGKNININQNGGTLSMDKSGLGIYLNGGTGNVNNTVINIADKDGVGIYTTNGATVTLGSTNTINAGDITGSLSGNASGSFGIVGKNNSTVNNNSNINVGIASIGIYAENSMINNGGNITAAGGSLDGKDGRVLIYGGKAETGNIGSVITNSGILSAGDMGVAIYSNTGSIVNNGEIITGNTYQNPLNPSDRQYAVGIYGAGTTSVNNTNKITFGENGLGIYLYTPNGTSQNSGLITSSANNAVGVYIEKGDTVSGVIQEFVNTGQIILTGDNSIGIAGVDNVKIVNSNLVEVTGKNSIGIYADTDSVVENNGTVKATGANGIGILLKNNSTLINNGIIDINISANGRAIVTDSAGTTRDLTTMYAEAVDQGVYSPVDHVGSGPSYTKPSIVNAGIIKVNERFEVPEDAVIQIKVNPDKLTDASLATSDYHPEDVNGKYLISNSVQFVAKEFVLRNVQVASDFSQGTNFKTYKLEDVFVPLTPGGGINYGKAAIKSKGILWEAVPITNSSGNLDIWMTKRDLTEFGDGLSWNNLADILDKNYEGATGDRLELYDKIDKIEDEFDLRRIMSSLSGAYYANRAQRGYDIKRGFDNALDIMENSENNTKENVKVAVLAGAGKTYENKDGVMDYKYETAGIYALREVERNYAHKFGYSLGYARNSFELQDGNSSEEWVDTMQIGAHNSYNKYGWKLRSDLTGRINMHNVDRNINWTDSVEKLDDKYMSYGVSLDNTLLREFELSKAFKISPLISLDFGYQYLDKVKEENSVSALEIDSNNAYSVKPGAGVRFEGNTALGSKTGWNLKSALEVKYEYELGDSQPEETARLMSFNESYKLAQPAEDKGELVLKAMLGVEAADRYGIFLTGEYGKSFNEVTKDGESYKIGVTLKAVF
jgi:hypothetical protein